MFTFSELDHLMDICLLPFDGVVYTFLLPPPPWRGQNSKMKQYQVIKICIFIINIHVSLEQWRLQTNIQLFLPLLVESGAYCGRG